MAVTKFPNPRSSFITPEGIIALGGDLDSASLLAAYRHGIFPWPIEGLPLTWFCPPERGVLEFDDLHIPRSLERARSRCGWRFTLDQDFKGVIEACAATPRPNQPGTWITDEMLRAYREFHQLGHAHSVEVWEAEELIGGLYGVEVEGVFAGESMFHRRSNASKLAILFLIDHLRKRGSDWMDIQVLTPHMESLGARVISRTEFLEKLERTQDRKLKLF